MGSEMCIRDRRIGFSIPTARRFSSNGANSRFRAFCESICAQEKLHAGVYTMNLVYIFQGCLVCATTPVVLVVLRVDLYVFYCRCGDKLRGKARFGSCTSKTNLSIELLYILGDIGLDIATIAVRIHENKS